MIDRMGVEGVQVDEVPVLDTIEDMAPVYGLIFLFKHVGSKVETGGEAVSHDVPGLFFAHQVITNACATQAILSVLMNTPDITLGPTLGTFKEFTAAMQPDMRGLSISNQEEIRSVHNSFSRQEQFSVERAATKDDDVFHFVAYVPHNGRIYELDGLRQTPIDHGAFSSDGGSGGAGAGDNGWLPRVREVLYARMQSYPMGEIRFNVLAVRGSVLAGAASRRDEIQALLMSLGDASSTESAALTAEAAECEATIAREEALRERYHIENERRKHNYIPLFLGLLRGMAQRGQLASAYDKAKTKAAARAQEAAAAKVGK